jgi:hypothetical protein
MSDHPTITAVEDSGLAPFTPEEQAIARRFIMGLRAMNAEHSTCAAESYLYAVEHLAREHPRHRQPALRLVAGGAP